MKKLILLDDFDKQKIIWPDISRKGNFVKADIPFLLTNTAYILVNGPEWLANYLNSKIANWYLKIISSSLGDDGSRFIKQFMVLLPIPNVNNQLNDFYKSLHLSAEEKQFLEQN